MIDQYLKPNVKRGAIYYAVIALVVGILASIPLLNCLLSPALCLTAILLPFAIGWLVAQWGGQMPMTNVTTPLAVRSDSPYTTPAVDGGVAAGVGSLVSGIIVWIIRLIFGSLLAIGTAGSAGDAGAATFGLALGGVFGIISAIVLAIIAAIAGAIGGILFVVFRQQRATPTPPATPPATPPTTM